jgi:hypothetical protein
MTETHVTNGTGTSESVTSEHVVTGPKRDRAAYMREYRRRVADNNPSQEFKDEIKPDHEIANSEIKPEPKLELKPEPNVGEPITAEEYERKVIPEADEATRALKARIAEIDQSQRLQREYQQQVDQANAQIDQIFNFWKQNGLSPDQQELFRADPTFMIRLTDFAHNEAIKLHPINSPEYFEAGKKLFFEHLGHLQDQARQHAAAPQPAPETEPMPPNNEQPPFFRPTPAPLPRRHEPSRRSVVSAPVSRESGLLSDGFDRKQQHTLSAAEAEAAKISGVTPTEYLKQKLKLQQMKANGEIV